MNRQTLATRLKVTAIPTALFFAILYLVACDTGSQSANTSNETTTLAPTLSRQEEVATFNAAKRNFDDKVSTHDAEIVLAVRLTQTAISLTPTYAPPPPEPTPTLELGILQDCISQGERAFFYDSCWRGIISDEVVTVAAGADQVPGAVLLQGEPTLGPAQGVVLVSIGENQPSSYMGQVEVYYTPDRLGGVHIASTGGTRLSIAPNQPNAQVTWIFDVSTRQFYTPSGTPVPVTVTPAAP